MPSALALGAVTLLAHGVKIIEYQRQRPTRQDAVTFLPTNS